MFVTRESAGSRESDARDKMTLHGVHLGRLPDAVRTDNARVGIPRLGGALGRRGDQSTPQYPDTGGAASPPVSG